MPYATLDDLESRYPGELAQAGPTVVGTLDEDAVARALAAADEPIHLTLRTIGWSVPLTAPVPAWVIALAVDFPQLDLAGPGVWKADLLWGVHVLLAHSARTLAPAVAYAATTALGIAPGQPTSSVVGADIQAYALFAINPRVWTIPTLAAVLLTEVPANATCSVAMVGSTARTLLSIGGNGFYPVLTGTGPATNASYGIAMLWE